MESVASGICCFLVLMVCVVDGYRVQDGPLLTERPRWLKMCKRSDPKLNMCLNNLFLEMFPELAKGIPEINIEGFEPLHLDRVSVSKGAGAVTLSGSFFDLVVTGPSKAVPTYTDLKIPERRLNFGIYLPRLDIKARYNLKGKILILPLVGHGDSEMTLEGVDTKVVTNISFPLREGREIIRIDSMNVSFTLEGIQSYLDNLFNGNKLLGNTLNNFLNEHGLEIAKELEESIGRSLSKIFTDIMNNIFLKMPTDLWMPKEEEKEGKTGEKKTTDSDTEQTTVKVKVETQ